MHLAFLFDLAAAIKTNSSIIISACNNLVIFSITDIDGYSMDVDASEIQER